MTTTTLTTGDGSPVQVETAEKAADMAATKPSRWIVNRPVRRLKGDF